MSMGTSWSGWPRGRSIIVSPTVIELVPAVDLEEGQVFRHGGLVWRVERIDGIVDGRVVMRSNCGSLLGVPANELVEIVAPTSVDVGIPRMIR